MRRGPSACRIRGLGVPRLCGVLRTRVPLLSTLWTMDLPIRFYTTPDGARIAYSVLGSGPPIVALPPLAEHLGIAWEFPARRRLWQELAQSYTVVVYDRWGTGLSDRDRTDFSRDADVRVLAALIDHLKLRRCALFGPSSGGPVAVTYAARYPHRLSHLVLYAISARLQTIAGWPAIREPLLTNFPLACTTLAYALHPSITPEEVMLYALMCRAAATGEVAVGLSEPPDGADVTPFLAALRVPTLVVVRGDDRPSLVEEAKRITTLVPRAQLNVVPGSACAALPGGDSRPLHRAVH